LPDPETTAIAAKVGGLLCHRTWVMLPVLLLLRLLLHYRCNPQARDSLFFNNQGQSPFSRSSYLSLTIDNASVTLGFENCIFDNYYRQNYLWHMMLP
jgi:hypothetical protein